MHLLETSGPGGCRWTGLPGAVRTRERLGVAGVAPAAPWPPPPRSDWLRRRDDSQVRAARRAGRHARGRRLGRTDLANGLGDGGQVVWRRLEVAFVTDQLPAARSRQSSGVGLAQVVGVRLAPYRQRPDHRGGLCVDVRQGGDRRPGAAVSGAAPWGPHGGTLPLPP